MSIYACTSMSSYACICLSVCLSICIPIYLSVYLSSVYLSIYLSIYLCIYLCIYQIFYLSIYVSMYVCMYVSTCSECLFFAAGTAYGTQGPIYTCRRKNDFFISFYFGSGCHATSCFGNGQTRSVTFVTSIFRIPDTRVHAHGDAGTAQ